MIDDSKGMSEGTMMKDDVMEDKKEMMNDTPEVAEEVMMKKEGKFVAYSAEEVASAS